ncbi:MAG TPA: TPM domain-containing protein [Pyrinomonadaceae bacterium]|nr:TPM domain-containing protein [Pyrinomonadaceae bacterium]
MTSTTRFHRESFRIALLGLALLGSLLALRGSAAAEQANSPLPPPNPFRYVVDNAGVIDSTTNQRMEKILRALKDSGDIEFAVVTVKTTGDQDIFDYSLAVARGWGIGSSEGEKNGLLLLVAIDDHKYFIQVSRHLEGDLPDGLVGEAGRRMRDPFRRGDYSSGLMTAVQTMVSTLEEKRGFSVSDVDKKYVYRPSAEPVRETGRSFSPWLFLIAIFVIILLISSRRRGGRGGGGGGWLNWLLVGMILNSGNRGSGWGGSSGSSGWSGGGFGGSGGGGFGGGGDFGGGGAGGSW